MPLALMQYSSQKLQNHFYALVYDQWHMSARGLRYLHEKSGADECYLAIFITSGISIYLVIGDYARFVANAILTAVPILLTYVYPEEKPPFDNLLCYWSIYVIATLFLDPKLEDKGSYYWMKMLLLILLITFPGTISADTPQNITTNEVPLTPLTISTPASIDQSQNISSKETEEPQFVPEHELMTVSVVESDILPAGKSKVPDASTKLTEISAKEHQILHDNKSQAVSTFDIETMVQKPPAKPQLSSWKKSDAVTEVKTQINHTKKIINTTEKQSLLTSSASISLERNEDSKKEISQNTAEENKSASVIRWVATGKTVVIIQNMQTGEPNKSQ
uniref:Receptor expression-enhancing protein n=1 Tax=Wuchereria bancrofti TaxID=6293 RepID=A0AAF5PU40_WUCBA